MFIVMLRVILDQMPRKHRKVVHSMFPLNTKRETKKKRYGSVVS